MSQSRGKSSYYLLYVALDVATMLYKWRNCAKINDFSYLGQTVRLPKMTLFRIFWNIVCMYVPYNNFVESTFLKFQIHIKTENASELHSKNMQPSYKFFFT